MYSTRTLLVAAAAVALLGSGCGDDGPDAAVADAPTVVATTSVWADVVGNVACDGLVEVETVVPIGGDPHGFEPSLADRATMDGADLIVANGLGLEEALQDTIKASEDAGTPVFAVADHVDTIPPFTARHDEDDHDEDDPDEDDPGEDDHDEHDHDGDDPHVWFDPVRVSDALDDLATALVDEAGLDAAAVDACVEEYRAELAAVDAEIADMVAAVPDGRRRLVTNHDALGYFAGRYGFEVIGTVIPAPSTLAQASPARLEELAEVISAAGVPALFAEVQHSTSDADALADRVGDVEVVTLLTGSLGEPGEGADTYIGFLRTNATSITAALS